MFTENLCHRDLWPSGLSQITDKIHTFQHIYSEYNEGTLFLFTRIYFRRIISCGVEEIDLVSHKPKIFDQNSIVRKKFPIQAAANFCQWFWSFCWHVHSNILAKILAMNLRFPLLVIFLSPLQTIHGPWIITRASQTTEAKGGNFIVKQ